jgi:hypothetical protein
MRFVPALLAAALQLLSSSAAFADDGTSKPAPKPIVVEGDRRICKSTVSTGSILPTTICKKASQWGKEIAESKRLADQRAQEQTVMTQSNIRAAKRNEGN